MNVVGLVLGWLLGILFGLLTLSMALMRNWLQAIPLWTGPRAEQFACRVTRVAVGRAGPRG